MSGLYTCSVQSSWLTSSIVTDTDASLEFRCVITSLTIASVSFVFCSSVLPGHSFTATWGIAVSWLSIQRASDFQPPLAHPFDHRGIAVREEAALAST